MGNMILWNVFDKVNRDDRNVFDKVNRDDRNNKNAESKSKNENSKEAAWKLRLAFFFFRTVGLATLSMRSDDSKLKLRTTANFEPLKYGIIYNLILICAMISSNYLFIPYRLYMEYPGKSNLTTGIEIIQGILGTTGVCVIFFRYCTKRKDFATVVNCCVNIKEEFRFTERPFYPKHFFSILLLVFVLNGCICLTISIVDMIVFQASPISWLSDIVPGFIINCFVLQYFFAVRVLEISFLDVNRSMENLSNFRPRSLSQNQRIFVSDSTVHQLIRLREIHGKLCKLSERIEEFYSFPILFCILFLFFTLIYNVYYFISPLVLHDKVATYDLALSTFLWLAFLLFPIIMLANRITEAMKVMDKTGTIVHMLLSRTIGETAKIELEQFSLELLHRRIRFTACDCFLLDNTLLHSIIATATTYLVILIQFHMGNVLEDPAPCNST